MQTPLLIGLQPQIHEHKMCKMDELQPRLPVEWGVGIAAMADQRYTHSLRWLERSWQQRQDGHTEREHARGTRHVHPQRADGDVGDAP